MSCKEEFMVFGIKKKIFNSAIDTAFGFAQEKLEELKEIVGDSDKDGVNDIDQLIAMLKAWPERLKSSFDKLNLEVLIDEVTKMVELFNKISEGVNAIKDILEKAEVLDSAKALIEDIKRIFGLVMEGLKRLKGVK